MSLSPDDAAMAAIEQLTSVALDVSRKIEKASHPAQDDFAVAYPRYLPDFIQFVHDLMDWRDVQRRLHDERATP